MVLGGNKRKIHTDSEEGFGVNASIRVVLFKKLVLIQKLNVLAWIRKKSRKQRKNGGHTRGNITGTDHLLK